MGVGTEEGWCFDRGFLGVRARLLQCFHHAYIWELLGDTRKSFSVDQNYMLWKWYPDRLFYATIFKRVFDIIRINTPLKKWNQMGKLWKAWFKWTGHWRAQSYYNSIFLEEISLSECRQQIIEAYSSGLGVPEAFGNLFWIKLEHV